MFTNISNSQMTLESYKQVDGNNDNKYVCQVLFHSKFLSKYTYSGGLELGEIYSLLKMTLCKYCFVNTISMKNLSEKPPLTQI